MPDPTSHPVIDIEERTVTADDQCELFVRRCLPSGSGRSEVPIVCCNGVGVSTFFWTYIERDFRAQRPVVVWDYRGHGRSQFPSRLDNLTMDRNANDLLAVLNGLGIDKAILLGHSMGCQVILEFARLYPDRVQALVPMLGTYGRPVHTFFNSPIISLLGFRALHSIVMNFHRPINNTSRFISNIPTVRTALAKLSKYAGIIDGQSMPDELLVKYIQHMGQLDARIFVRMVEKMALHSVEQDLPKILAPTLVVAGTHDYFTPLWLSEEMADRLPHGELLIVPNGSHAAQAEQPELICLKLERFLERVAPLSMNSRAANVSA